MDDATRFTETETALVCSTCCSPASALRKMAEATTAHSPAHVEGDAFDRALAVVVGA